MRKFKPLTILVAMVLIASAIFAVPQRAAADSDSRPLAHERTGERLGPDGPSIGPAAGACDHTEIERSVTWNPNVPTLPFTQFMTLHQLPSPTWNTRQSGIAFSEVNNEYWTTDAENDQVIVRDMATHAAKRTLDASQFAGNLQDIAAMGEDRFALLDKTTGRVHVVVEDTASSTLTVVVDFETCLPILPDGNGLEGIAHVPRRPWQNYETFLTAWNGEQGGNPGVYQIRLFDDGSVRSAGPLALPLPDAAGLFQMADGSLLIVSRLGGTIIAVDSFLTGQMVGWFGVGLGLGQPSGLAVNAAGDELWNIGDPNDLAIYYG